jgi:hypothetical protein
MWISTAWFCITDDVVCSSASLEEISRRKEEYTTMVARWDGEQSWVEKCEELEKECEKFIGK